jgi:hypothetical protein
MKAIATLLAILATTAMLAVGCGDDELTTPTVPDTTTAADDDGPLVVYERAGGIAYTAQRLVIEEDGSATVTVEGPGEIGAEFQLSESELDELRALLDAASFETPEPSGCADCYAYVIESGDESATFDQVNFPEGTEPLVEFLSKIVERETPSGPARDG